MCKPFGIYFFVDLYAISLHRFAFMFAFTLQPRRMHTRPSDMKSHTICSLLVNIRFLVGHLLKRLSVLKVKCNKLIVSVVKENQKQERKNNHFLHAAIEINDNDSNWEQNVSIVIL